MWSDPSWNHLDQAMLTLARQVEDFRALMASKGRDGLPPWDAHAELTRPGGVQDSMDAVWAPVHWDLPSD